MKNIHQLLKPNQRQLQVITTPSLLQHPSSKIASFLQNPNKNKTHLNQIHSHLITTGLIIHNLPLTSKLVSSYASIPQLNTISIAFSIANRINGLDTYTYNTIIRAYLDANQPKSAFLVYTHIRNRGLVVDSYTLLFLVKASGIMNVKSQGEQIHSEIFKMGFESEVIIQTVLLTMYDSLEEIDCMQQVFDEMSERDIVAWNSLMAAYVQQNIPGKAVAVFRDMARRSNVKPNGSTVVTVLSGCSSLTSLTEGKQIHGYVIRNFIESDVFVENSLMRMYSRCRSLSYASRVFEKIRVKNVVTWTTMIGGYNENNCLNEALALFKHMKSENVKVDEITMLVVVSVCAKLGSFEIGYRVDRYIEETGIGKASVTLNNALIDMHAKCGNVNKSCRIFDGMGRSRTLVSWTSVINGLAMHGFGLSGLVRFVQMQREGFEPDGVVFLSVLTGCSHSGLVDEGKKCFDSMTRDYKIKPWMEHYGCMVDLYCRAGLVEDAFRFIVNMDRVPDSVVWRTLVSACRNMGETGLASRVMKFLRENGVENCEDYVMISNVFASMNDWVGVKEVRREMEIKRLIKPEPGYTSIEVNQEMCC